MAAVLFILSGNAQATLIQSTLNTLPSASGDYGCDATEVDYWYFTVNTNSTVTIDTKSWSWDADGDGIAHFMDPFIYLFNDDGSLDTGDILAWNDDGDSYTYGDGSTNGRDSYLSVALGADSYVLAIGTYHLSLEAAVAGINFRSHGPYVQVGDDLSTFDRNSLHSPCQLGCAYADYQITFGGDITMQTVPEPSTFALLRLGICRRKKI